MALDGLFLHHLINEVKDKIEGKMIYKVISINDTDYLFSLSNKLNLLISVNPSHAHIRITNTNYVQSNSLLSLYMHKHIDGGIITNISQYHNDRLAIITITNKDELGYQKEYKMYLELMGKNSNLIITDNNDIILEAVKKSYLTDEHLIKTGIKYIPLEDNKINPFNILNFNDYDLFNLQGLSKQVVNEISILGLENIIKREIKPILIQGSKTIFYCFDLESIEGKRTYFNSLSECLEYYYDNILKTTNDSLDLANTRKFIIKEIEKLENKLEKQKIELENAKDNESLEIKANLLLSNIHLIKSFSTEIKVINYYDNNKEITIELNPNLSASENVNGYFNKIKKNKRAVISLSKTIQDTANDIDYFKANLAYLDFLKAGDLKEMMIELGLRKLTLKNVKPHISRYQDEFGNIYFYGKNNTQNNYLTHTLAHNDDYFFHVKNIPGSHVILRGELNEQSIQTAADIAAYYSKVSDSIHVCVDYTLVKWVKKIKGEKGSFVTYTHEKMAFSDPSIDKLKHLKVIN